jgi:hypothetical protein
MAEKDNNPLLMANTRYSGNGNDPTFTPQIQEEAPHDLMHAIDGLQTMHMPAQPSTGRSDVTPEGIAERLQAMDDAVQEGEKPQPPMSEAELLALIKRKVETSHQWYGSGKLSSKRIDADRYYRGEPLGNELDGRSQVVSRDVAEAVDGAMPSMMRVFAGGEQVCAFEPNGPEDEEAAKQATDYINNIFMQENEGFMLLYTWFKDAFLKKNGIVKAWHDVRWKRTKENYQGLTIPQLQSLQQNPNIQVVDVRQYQDVIQQMDGFTGQTISQPIDLCDCVVICTKPEKKIRVENVPPDEFIIERRATSIYTAGFLAHRGKRTISDLLECGYDADKIADIPRGEDHDYTQERIQRFSDEDQLPYGSDDEADPTMRKVWVTEAYVKCDFDGDGIAEWRMVTLAGDSAQGAVILGNEETDDHPFADLTPDPEPHKFYGQSLFDKTKDIQEIKTALIRGILDSTYLANAPRLGFVEGQVNMDDLLDVRPGGVVRMKRPDALTPIPSTLVSDAAMQVVNYIDSVKETRTGIKAMSAGLSPNILNSSATGADILNNNNQQHLELMCRIFAETGVKRLFRIIFKLVCQHQNVPRTVRLRNKWVQVNPMDWKDRMDVSATVGIGLGSKTQQAAIAQQLLQIDQQIIQMQGGVDGPIVKLDNVYNKLTKLVEAVGWKTPDPYYSDPKDFTPPAPKPPTPEQQVHMAELNSKATAAQANSDSAKASALSNIKTKQLDYEMRKLDLAIKQVELAALQYQSNNQMAQRADNETQYSNIPESTT